MGNEDKRIFIFLQIPLQPFDMLLVQIIGRLVQKQNIRLLKQQLSKQHLGSLAAGQLCHILLHSDVSQAQSPSYLVYLGVNGIEIVSH